MRHYVLTRSAYGTAWDLEANARRLDMTRAVTIASMGDQTSKDWTWLVLMDDGDPLGSERRRLFESAGVPVRFLAMRSESTRSVAAVEAYRAPWNDLIGLRDEPIAMTRLDDDDGLADWAIASIGQAAMRIAKRTVLMLPRGVRVFDGRYIIVRHDSNAMQTLVTPPGDTLHVYAYPHRKARAIAPVRTVDPRIGWVWSRHADTISGWRTAESPIDDRIRRMFAIDWSVFGPSTPGHRLRGVPAGRHFR